MMMDTLDQIVMRGKLIGLFLGEYLADDRVPFTKEDDTLDDILVVDDVTVRVTLGPPRVA